MPDAAVDLPELATFVRVAARGSLSRAARELGVPVSTVSRRLSALEARLGVQLIERSTHAVRVTPLGAVYREHCERALAAIEDGERTLRALDEVPQGTLRVTAPHAFGEAVLGPILDAFALAFPSVAVRVRLSDEVLDLAQHGFELAFRFGPRADPAVVATVVGAAEMVLCAAPSYLAHAPAPARPDELARHALLAFAAGETARVAFAHGPAVDARPRVVVNSFPLLTELCLAGRGVGLLPAFYARPHLARGALVHLLAAHPLAGTKVLLARPAAARPTRAVRAFLQIAKQQLARVPWSSARAPRRAGFDRG